MTDKIKELPDSERPYERCEKLGPEYLSDAELLAVILRTGSREMSSLDTAREILKKTVNGESIAGIEHIGDEELLKIPGIGRVKLILLKCLTEFSKRLWKAKVRGNIRFSDPKSCAMYFMEDMRHLAHEEVRVLSLDSKSNYISSKVITVGLQDRSLLSPREVFSYALKQGAAQIIVMHNHPSGDPTPSGNDIEIARELIITGEIIGIRLADFIIIGDGVYLSFRQRFGAEWQNIKEITI